MESPLTVKAAILQALIRGEAFGLEIVERVDGLSAGRIKINQGALYPALRTLQKDGLIKSREGQLLPERGGRPRIYYKLTSAGRRVAAEQDIALRGLVLGELELSRG